MTVKALKWSLPLALAALLTLPATAQSAQREDSRGMVVDAATDRFEAVRDYHADRGRHRGHGRGHRKGNKYDGHHGKHRHHRRHKHYRHHHWQKYHRPPVIWRHYGPGRYRHGHRHRGPHGRFELHFNIGGHH